VGNKYIQQKIAEAQKQLSDLGLFQEVHVQASETEIPNNYLVTIRVVEARPYEIAYSCGYNSEKKLEGSFEISDRNFLGGSQSLSLLTKINSEDRVARLIYHVPD